MMKTIVALLILLMTGCDRDGKRLIVATDATLPPLTFINDRNELVGFEIDLIREIAKKTGLDMEWVNVEWEGLFGGLITKKYDMVISSVTILEERKKRMTFSRPYLRSGIALVVRKEMEGVASLEDADKKNLPVGAQVGTTAYFLLEKYPHIRRKGYQLYGHAVADLIKGDIDVVVGESTGTLYYRNQQTEYFQRIKMVGEILTNEHYGIVLRPEDTRLLKQVNTALADLLKTGVVQKLHEKWGLGKAAQVPEP